MNSRFGLDPLARAARRPSGAVATYAEVLRDTYSASEIWPLVDIASGTNIDAFINSARDGTLTGWDLQNAAGPVTGTLAPYSDGANDQGDIFTSNGSTGLADIIDWEVGNIFLWGKLNELWSDSGARTLLYLYIDISNRILIRKSTGDSKIYIFFQNSSNKTINIVTSTAEYFSLGLSWDINAGVSGELKAYFNGVQNGSTTTNLGVFTGDLTSATIGATPGPAGSWKGWLSYYAMKFGSIWSTADFLAMHNAASTAGPD